MNTVKIVHIAPAVSNNGGGISDVVENLSAAQSKNGHQVTIFGGGELDVQRRKGFVYQVLTLHSLFSLVAMLRNNKNCKVFIHGAWSISFLYVLIALIFVKFKYVYQTHGLLSWEQIQFKSKFKKMVAWHVYQKFIFRNATKILATSEVEVEGLDWAVTPETQLQCIPLGIAPEFFSTPKMACNDSEKLLFLSQIIPVKGLDLLFEAIAVASKEYNKKIFVDIYGYGGEKYITHLQKLADSLSITEQIQFKGKVERNQRISIYDKYRWFVLPSRHESFGLVVAEALVRGCHVITTSGTPWMESERYRLNVITLNVQNLVSEIIKAYDTVSNARDHEIISDFSEFNWENIAFKLDFLLDE